MGSLNNEVRGNHMIMISEVIGRAEQGKSHVYLCRGDDDRLYYVKGLCCGRKSQVAEWVCAHLARQLGLPFPEFHLVDIPEELYEYLPSQQREIGYGPAFATVQVDRSRWFDNTSVRSVEPELATKVLLFDYWIQNMDRYIENTNVLVKADDQSIVLIDHNLAFDPDFDTETFFELHIFGTFRSYWTENLVNQAHYKSILIAAQARLDRILAHVPKEWHWSNMEQDIPADLDTGSISTILDRQLLPEFWRHE